jgi:hypothetical protein
MITTAGFFGFAGDEAVPAATVSTVKSTGRSTTAVLIACVLGLTACGSSTPAATSSSAASTSSSMTPSMQSEASSVVSSATSSATSLASSAGSSGGAATSGAISSSASSSDTAASAVVSSPTASSDAGQASASSTSGSTRPESTIAGSGGVIKAGAATKLPAKLGTWIKAAGSGPGTIYNKGGSSIIISFLPGSDYAGVAASVTNSKTRVGSGICGSTSVAANLTCYLKTADGVLNLSSDANDTPLVALVDFADQLTHTLGTT